MWHNTEIFLFWLQLIEINIVKLQGFCAGSPLLNSEFKGQLAKARYFPKQNAEKNIAIYDTRKRKNLGLLSKSGSFDNASSSVKLNGKCSEVVANDLANTPGSNSLKVLTCMKLLSSL